MVEKEDLSYYTSNMEEVEYLYRHSFSEVIVPTSPSTITFEDNEIDLSKPKLTLADFEMKQRNIDNAIFFLQALILFAMMYSIFLFLEMITLTNTFYIFDTQFGCCMSYKMFVQIQNCEDIYQREMEIDDQWYDFE